MLQDKSVDLLQLMINAHKEEDSTNTTDVTDESYEQARAMGVS